MPSLPGYRSILSFAIVAIACGSSFGQKTASDTGPATLKQIQAEKQHQNDIQNDVDLGRKAAEETEKELKLSTNAAYQARVQRIGADIAAIAQTNQVNVLWGDRRLNRFDYTFKVVQGEDVNAFSLPGGHIYVFEGLMKQIQSDDELAGVLAHETSHAAFRHVAQLQKDQAKMMNISLPAILAALLLGHGSAANFAIPGIQLMTTAQVNGWSVKAEEAADYGGMQYMIKSHYDPTGMLTFMERLAAEEKLGANYNWGIYRDHPPGRERAESLQHYMEEAHVKIRRSRVTSSYRVNVHPGEHGTVVLDFGDKPLIALGGPDALKRADAEAEILDEFFDATPEMFELQEGPNYSLLWNNKTILALTQEDADANGARLADLQELAIKNFRIALYNLGFHVWAAHV